MEVFENAEKGENRLFEEEEIEKKTKAYKKKKGWMEIRQASILLHQLLDSCLLDDRIKESFNMTYVL